MEIITNPVSSFISLARAFKELELGSPVGLINLFFGLLLFFYVIGNYVTDTFKRMIDWAAYKVVGKNHPNNALEQVALPKYSKFSFFIFLGIFFLLCTIIVGCFK